MSRTKNGSEEGLVNPSFSGVCPARMLKHPTQQRSQLLVLSIREAVVQLALSQGASGLAIKDISRRAGVSNGSIYQYFQGIEGIVASVYEDMLMAILDLFPAHQKLSLANKQQLEQYLRRLDTIFDVIQGRACYMPLLNANITASTALTIMLETFMCWDARTLSPRHYWQPLLASVWQHNPSRQIPYEGTRQSYG